MKEYIGCCLYCKKEIYCLDGFFNGVHTETKDLLCFDCFEKQEKQKEDPQR